MPVHDNNRFIIIGENIHTTRVLTRKSPRVASNGGREGLVFTDVDGAAHFLDFPEQMKRSQDYQEGRIKHVKLAVQAAMGDEPGRSAAGKAYLSQLAVSQQIAGAAFLDVNVDEISIRSADQKAAMAWLAAFIQTVSELPLSIDSSNLEVIEVGMAVCASGRDRPLLNSASLERIDALNIAQKTKARVVITAAGERGMPSGVADRVANASRMIEAARARDIEDQDLFVDPLVFPISVDKSFALHSLDAMRQIRSKFGTDIHITGGFSNVSFGIPHRRAINDLFLLLAVEAGADSGIIDPVGNPPERASSIDRSSKVFQLAEDVLTGRDEHCRNFIRAWRKGEIQ
jgi:5-methyltetrahydrofolate corrinoid/iron sulfur protein methyltransferase